MKPPATRILRRLLLAVVVVVGAAVAWTVRRPSPPSPMGSGSSGGPTEGTTIGDMAFFRFEEGEQKIELKARDSRRDKDGVAHLQGVEVTFPYVYEDRESTATITSDEGRWDAHREEAHFQGNVHVTTSDGFELWTEGLDYFGRSGRVVSEVDVRFERGAATGRARGAEYRAGDDRLELKSQVWIRFEGDGGDPATEIESGRAFGSRKTRLVNFGQGVELRQGTRVLHSRRLQLHLDEELERVTRGAAIQDVDLRTGGGGELGGVELPAGGERRLRCRRLNLDFRPGGELRRAVAINHSQLELLPGPGEQPVRRRVVGRQIQFHFDAQGRLHSVVSHTGGPRPDVTIRPVVLTSEPLRPGQGVTRRVECRYFKWTLDPATGALRSALFKEKVSFVEPGRRGWAEKATYDEGSGLLRLSGGSPRIQDEGDGSELRAQRIDVDTETGGIVAVGGVRHAIRPSRDDRGGGMLAGSQATILVCHRFEYDPSLRKAWYRENALLRAGDDEVRAPLIVLEEPAPAERRLRASDGVVSLLHPRSKPDAEEEPAPVQTRSRDMVYEEVAGRVVYTGDVEIRQGDIVTRSPKAVVTLGDSGDEVERIVAGEPVQVSQGARRADGRVGTYTPSSETMVLEGDEVVLRDEDRSIRGRVLTFQVGEDRIRVDGQDEVRAEAIFRTRERPSP